MKYENCDYCNCPSRILIFRNGLRFMIDGQENLIHTFGKDSKMCLDCFKYDLIESLGDDEEFHETL